MSATTAGACFYTLARTVWPRHTTKHMARAADVPISTAKGWAIGRFVPSANTLLRMAQRDRDLAHALLASLADTTTSEAAAGEGLDPGDDRADRAAGVKA